jgi:hypothetical protein
MNFSLRKLCENNNVNCDPVIQLFRCSQKTNLFVNRRKRPVSFQSGDELETEDESHVL